MITPDVILGRDVVIPQPDLVNLYGCTIGDGTKIGAFVEVQGGAVIGRNCTLSTHSFVCAGVTIEDGVFVGHGVMFINDLYPRAVRPDGTRKTDWDMVETRVREAATIGSNATILGGVTVGARAMIGAGAVVTRDVPDFAVVTGNPARVTGDAREREPA